MDHRKSEPSADAFTLVELLAVIAVISLLMAFVGMSITSMGQSQKLQLAGISSIELINYARQLAKTENTSTRVALLDSGLEAGRVMTVLQYSREEAKWKQVDRWIVMPEGFQLDLAGQASPLANSQALFTAPNPAVSLKRAGADVSALAMEFLPSGRPNVDGSLPLVGTIRDTNANGADFYRIIVNPTTGMAVARRPALSTETE